MPNIQFIPNAMPAFSRLQSAASRTCELRAKNAKNLIGRRQKLVRLLIGYVLVMVSKRRTIVYIEQCPLFAAGDRAHCGSRCAL